VTVDAVVLAGGDGAVIDPGCRFKGLVPIAGRPMVEWVVDALRAAETVEEIAVVVPTAEDLGPWADKPDKIVVSPRGFMDNVLEGVGAFRQDRPVLVATGDLPTMTGEEIDDFVRDSLATGADFTYPLIPRKDVEEAYPGSERTYFKLASGWFTGGNIGLMNPAVAMKNREMGQRLFELRKSAVSMVRILGVGFAVKFLLGRLRASEVEDKMEELIGGTGAAVVTRHAAIGMDVDKPADVALVERALGDRAGRTAAG
jgi:GTP:adenosylcobinamide-phosphate guanylyltransferase